MLERFGELRVFRRVPCGESRDASRGFGVIVVEEQSFAVAARGKETRVGAQDFAIELLRREVASHIRAKRPHRMRQGGNAEPRMKFLGHGAASNNFAAFEHHGLESALRQVIRGDQGVVPSAYDRDLLPDRHALNSPAPRRLLFSTP